MGNGQSVVTIVDDDGEGKGIIARFGKKKEVKYDDRSPPPPPKTTPLALHFDKEPSVEIEHQVCDDSDSDYGNYVSAESDLSDMNIRVGHSSYSESVAYHDAGADADELRDDYSSEEIRMRELNISQDTISHDENTGDSFDPYDTDEDEENYLPLCKKNRNFSMPFRACRSTGSIRKEENAYYSDGEVGKKRPRSTSSNFLFGQGLSLSYPSIAPLQLNISSSEQNYNDDELLMEGGHLPTPESELKPKILETMPSAQDQREHPTRKNVVVKCRSFHVITTATLPWMTGTAVNPLLRAVYLNKMNRTSVENALGERGTSRVYEMMGTVTLVVPWVLDENDQRQIYGGTKFESQYEQEMYVRKWIRESAQMPLEADLETNGIRISFYNAHYIADFKSILPTDYICDQIAAQDADVCILDEPEHLNILTTQTTEPFNHTFSHVVGIMHTNYVAYLKDNVKSIVFAPIAALMCSSTTRFHCDKIVKLSGTLQTFAKEKECIVNVHGIRQDFLDEGKRRVAAQARDQVEGNKDTCTDADTNADASSDRIYFIGKLLWAKGLHILLELQAAYKNATGEYFPIDIIGSGPEENEIQRAFQLSRLRSLSDGDDERRSKSVKDQMDKLIHDIPRSRFELRKDPIPSRFLGRKDHALLGAKYKIFVNPSVTEVLCTTTAEAIAMNKFVIIPMHPSNLFFEQFPNCFLYKSKREFISYLQHAIQNDPTPLSEEDAYQLTWDAATERCMDAAIVTRREAARRERVGQREIDLRAAEYSKSRIFDAIRQFLVGRMNEKMESLQSELQLQ